MYDQLERMKDQLQLCQKALENYLGRVDSMFALSNLSLSFQRSNDWRFHGEQKTGGGPTKEDRVSSSFFFVSGSELLEFLSNGNEPEKVMRLLKKVFDSLNKLDLREDAHGKTMKMAHASPCATINAVLARYYSFPVYSDDGERVTFFADCNLDGAVEIWLLHLLEFHCETVRNWLRVAVNASEVGS